MILIPAVPMVTGDFDFHMEVSPATIEPGPRVRLRFSVFNPKTGEQVRQFGLIHDKLFHLFVVSQDMMEFQHIHPSLQADGSFVIQTVLPRPGHYKVYADLYPLDGTPQVLDCDLMTG